MAITTKPKLSRKAPFVMAHSIRAYNLKLHRPKKRGGEVQPEQTEIVDLGTWLECDRWKDQFIELRTMSGERMTVFALTGDASINPLGLSFHRMFLGSGDDPSEFAILNASPKISALVSGREEEPG